MLLPDGGNVLDISGGAIDVRTMDFLTVSRAVVIPVRPEGYDDFMRFHETMRIIGDVNPGARIVVVPNNSDPRTLRETEDVVRGDYPAAAVVSLKRTTLIGRLLDGESPLEKMRLSGVAARHLREFQRQAQAVFAAVDEAMKEDD
jgi:cellulose biosynthesis protein BcsQ